MQVKELNPGSTSIKWFVVMAVGLTVTSYGIRLLIRSEAVTGALRKMMADVRSHASETSPAGPSMRTRLPENQPVPTRVFLGWAWTKVFEPFSSRSLSCIGISLCAVIPLFSVWTSSTLLSGLKVVISIGVSLSLVVCICVVNAAYLDNPLRRKVTRSYRRRRSRLVEDHTRAGV